MPRTGAAGASPRPDSGARPLMEGGASSLDACVELRGGGRLLLLRRRRGASVTFGSVPCQAIPKTGGETSGRVRGNTPTWHVTFEVPHHGKSLALPSLRVGVQENLIRRKEREVAERGVWDTPSSWMATPKHSDRSPGAGKLTIPCRL